MRRIGLLVLIGCSSSSPSPDASIECEYVATVNWSTQAIPDVISVTVDGRTVASGETYSLNEFYPSYDDAIATFRPRPVVVTTTTETLMFQLDVQGCPTYMFDAPITMESDRFDVQQSLSRPVDFFSDSGSCASNDGHVLSWSARSR